MVRGYDVIFQNKFLGYLLVSALIFLFVALMVVGSLYAKRIMDKDSAARKQYREDHPESTNRPS
ncbi:MAG: hypothetical protein JST12_03640 [Armatimonadetes bacterium]|nr:hypothetical protein [Armatimonadota bacterium]MBS1700728.1 hypothetical protein [Armatimonadota bacterium]MBS1728782.1 hypothetical protein [Armatimonadota bacterium]